MRTVILYVTHGNLWVDGNSMVRMFVAMFAHFVIYSIICSRDSISSLLYLLYVSDLAYFHGRDIGIRDHHLQFGLPTLADARRAVPSI